MTDRARLIPASIVSAFLVVSAPAVAAEKCPVTHDQLASALKASVKPAGGPSNGGFDNNMWASIVTRDGTVCAVAFSGARWDDQWPGSRIISVQKAGTANAFSLAKSAFSTAQMFAASQPGGFLYGLSATNLASANETNAGDANQFGSNADPLVGKRVGGIVVFGGGLALYTQSAVVGGLGVSGDTSCGDHNVAWRVRQALGMGNVPAGPGGLKNDGIIYDIGVTGSSSSGFGHPKCAGKEDSVAKDLGAGGSSAPK